MSKTPSPSDVVVIGSLNLDLVASVARLPATGETLTGSAFATHHGGKGGNQAVAAARLGAGVAMIGKIGADDAGNRLCRALIDEGIDVAGISQHGELPTGTALITVDVDGRNTIVVIPGSNAALSIADVDRHRQMLEHARCVICQLEVDDEVTAHALRLAQSIGIRSFLNPAPAPGDPSAWRARLPLVSTLVVNETEAELLSGLSVKSPEAARAAARNLLAAGCEEVIVTLGADGALRATREGEVHHAGCRVTAVDSTAAGDTFIGGLAAAFVAGLRNAEAVMFAQQAAALSVTRRGAQSSIPTLDELLAWSRA
jgi:ribokinase